MTDRHQVTHSDATPAKLSCTKSAHNLGSPVPLGAFGMAGAKRLMPPQHFPFDFGGYRIWKLLGCSGICFVYEADQLSTGRRVTLNIFGDRSGNSEARQRFQMLGTLAAQVNHPNSVYVFSTEEIEGTPVFVMEWVRGTLKDKLQSGPMEPSAAVDAILQVVSGLEAAAKQGVLHRNINPANCFQGVGGEVKVGYYGLSISFLTEGETQLKTGAGSMCSYGFASPEHLRGDPVDVRSDIYSVGATLYALLSGSAPFEDEDDAQVVAQVLDKQFVPIRERVPSLPTGLAQAVDGCLAKRREDRFPDYESLQDALRAYSSKPLEAAPLGLRFSSWLIDTLALVVVMKTLAILLIALDEKSLSIAECLIGAGVAYFTACDGILDGRTMGRDFLGLRLLLACSPWAVARAKPGLRARLRCLFSKSWWRAYATAWARLLLLHGAALAVAFVPLPFLSPEFECWARWILVPLAALVPFCTARHRNGYAGWHDLLTHTRVVRFPKVSL